jgi:hypothetical protein
MRRSLSSLCLLALVAADVARAQQPAPTTTPAGPLATYVAEGNYTQYRLRDDHRELQLYGGFRFTAPHLGLDLRGRNALLLSDPLGTQELLADGNDDAMPTRGLPNPPARRRLSQEQVRAQVERSLRAIGQASAVAPAGRFDDKLDLLRYLYCEGGVTVVQGGVEVLRCERLWLSPLDDRIVVEDAELRYLTPGSPGGEMLVVRGPRLVKQGGRWTGRDVTVTTCTAAEPHAQLAAGEVEILERDGEFEVRLRGQSLMVGGTRVLPLPDARVFTGDQSQFPIRRARAGYSGKEGARAEIVFGMPWNETGGELHRWLTGRPAEEFRGDWELGVGWIEARGVPLEGALEYRAGELYRGRTEAFWLDDRGDDLREIRTDLGGTPIDTEQRGILRTENRLQFGKSTYATLEAFHSSDEAAYAEFWNGEYRNHELPESALYLHHADGNRLFTVGTRFSLTDFSYRADRALADRFVEELPVVTYHWLAQPITELPWGTPLVLDSATEIGQRRSAYDDDSTLWTAGDRTLRADQSFELSSPMQWGPVSVRPYLNLRGTWYDNSRDGSDEGRVAFEGGVQFGTRLSQTWSWLGDGSDTVRHVVAPRLWIADRFHTTGDPGRLFAFDGLDALDEQTLVRVEVRNLFQRMERTGNATFGGDGSEPRDFLFLDLAQDFWPNPTRDNDGDVLGLFYYDFLIRPRARWIPFETFSYGLYGDHDWDDGLRTLDTELTFGPLAGVTWTTSYRTDRDVSGAVGVYGRAELLDRWELLGGSQYDLESDDWLSYRFGVQRNDHDWSIMLSAAYNPYSEETSLRIEFLPRFGGMGKSRDRFFGGPDLSADAFAAGY